MIPRLTTRGRKLEAQYQLLGRGDRRIYFDASRPSPAERLRQRRKAMSRCLRYRETLMSAWDKQQRGYYLPQSRGTTTGQLVAMHLEAES